MQQINIGIDTINKIYHMYHYERRILRSHKNFIFFKYKIQ